MRTKNLSVLEWELVAEWWTNRFKDSQDKLKEYKEHRDFEKFHHNLTTTCELLPTQQVDVIYDPALTLAKIKAEMDKKVKALNVAVVLVTISIKLSDPLYHHAWDSMTDGTNRGEQSPQIYGTGV